MVLHFPPSIYQRTDAAEMLPPLLEILNPEDLRCAQFLPGGRVRLSFREKSVRDHLLTEGPFFGDEDIPVIRHAENLTLCTFENSHTKVPVMTCSVSAVLLARS